MIDKFLLIHPGPDIVIRRGFFIRSTGDGPAPLPVVQVNVPRLVRKYGDDFECGRACRGAADLSLSILDHFLPGSEVECLDGTRASRAAIHLHLMFLADFVAKLPHAGGILYAKAIQGWIGAELARRPLPREVEAAHVGYTGAAAERLDAALGGPEKAQAVIEADAGAWLREDLRRLVRLTEDFLHDSGHRVVVHLPPPRPNPMRLQKTLVELDRLLTDLGQRIDITPPAPNGEGRN